jgi:hypothetical protein
MGLQKSLARVNTSHDDLARTDSQIDVINRPVLQKAFGVCVGSGLAARTGRGAIPNVRLVVCRRLTSPSPVFLRVNGAVVARAAVCYATVPRAEVLGWYLTSSFASDTENLRKPAHSPMGFSEQRTRPIKGRERRYVGGRRIVMDLVFVESAALE